MPPSRPAKTYLLKVLSPHELEHKTFKVSLPEDLQPGQRVELTMVAVVKAVLPLLLLAALLTGCVSPCAGAVCR